VCIAYTSVGEKEECKRRGKELCMTCHTYQSTCLLFLLAMSSLGRTAGMHDVANVALFE